MRALAVEACASWQIEPSSLEHVADAGNSVWAALLAGQQVALRLTDPSHRTPPQTEAELRFVRHVAAAGVRVAEPVASAAGRDLERVGPGWSAAVFRWAPGSYVRRGDPADGEAMHRAWGQALAGIHAASQTFAPAPAPRRRWRWRDEHWVADAHQLVPIDDAPVRAELDAVLDALNHATPPAAGGFGMIHADLAPQNFRWDVARRQLTTFDFGNCCHAWHLLDLVISLTTVVRRPGAESDDRMRWLIEAYAARRTLDPGAAPMVGWLVRFRLIYVLLSRLWAFGSRPTAAQRETLAILRERVLEGPTRWAPQIVSAYQRGCDPSSRLDGC